MVTKSRIHSMNKLTFNGKAIEQVFFFKYLGIEIIFDNNDLLTQHDLYKEVSYVKLMRSINPSPNPCTSLHLFEQLVKPILLYGSEIWSPIDLKYTGNITNYLNLSENAKFHKYIRSIFPYI